MASECGKRLELVISWLQVWIAVERNHDVEQKIQQHIDLVVRIENEKPIEAAKRLRERIAFARFRKEVPGNIRRCQQYINRTVRNSIGMDR